MPEHRPVDQGTPDADNELVAISMYARAFGTIEDLLDRDPGAFTDAQLIEMQESLLALDDDTLRISLEAERWSLLDSIQRSYTDDGAGGGHFVAPQFVYVPGDGWVYDSWDGSTRGYIRSFLSPGRRDVERVINHLFDEADAIADTPLWERDDVHPSENSIDALSLDWRWRFSYARLMVDILMPINGRASVNAERIILERDAALAVIALERFKRANYRWPDSLDQLIPGFLPAMPIDRFDGKPLKYINRGPDEKPLLYSVGANFIDDGGVPALDQDGHPDNARTSRWIAPAMIRAIKDGTYVDDRSEIQRKLHPIETLLPPDADFILWPPLPTNPPDPEPESDDMDW